MVPGLLASVFSIASSCICGEQLHAPAAGLAEIAEYYSCRAEDHEAEAAIQAVVERAMIFEPGGGEVHWDRARLDEWAADPPPEFRMERSDEVDGGSWSMVVFGVGELEGRSWIITSRNLGFRQLSTACTTIPRPQLEDVGVLVPIMALLQGVVATRWSAANRTTWGLREFHAGGAFKGGWEIIANDVARFSFGSSGGLNELTFLLLRQIDPADAENFANSEPSICQRLWSTPLRAARASLRPGNDDIRVVAQGLRLRERSFPTGLPFRLVPIVTAERGPAVVIVGTGLMTGESFVMRRGPEGRRWRFEERCPSATVRRIGPSHRARVPT
jgi:hypothetical protein